MANEMRKVMNQNAMRDTMRRNATTERTRKYATSETAELFADLDRDALVAWTTIKAQRDDALADVDVLRGRLTEMEAEVVRLRAYAEDRLAQQSAVQRYARGYKHRADNVTAELARLRASIADLAD